jgi:hypothetical protein
MQNFDFKIEISQFNQQKKRSKTLANYSNIKPTLPSYRRILKKNEISIESNSYLFPSKTSSLGHISRKQCGSIKPD